MKTKHTAFAFTRSHGELPKGRGSWAFEIELQTITGFCEVVEECWFAPGPLTLTEARKDAVVHAKQLIAEKFPTVVFSTVYTDVLA